MLRNCPGACELSGLRRQKKINFEESYHRRGLSPKAPALLIPVQDAGALRRGRRSSGPKSVTFAASAHLFIYCVYHIIDGVEGDTVNDPESVFHGKRMKNGWKKSGLPWTCDLDPALMYLEREQ